MNKTDTTTFNFNNWLPAGIVLLNCLIEIVGLSVIQVKPLCLKHLVQTLVPPVLKITKHDRKHIYMIYDVFECVKKIIKGNMPYISGQKTGALKCGG